MVRKVCIIAPSSLRYMPYLRCYEEVLQALAAPYDILYWDRYELEEEKENAIAFQRPRARGGAALLSGYVAYRHFLIRHLQVIFSVHADSFLIYGISVMKDFCRIASRSGAS
jgi:hypothetical protein